MAGAGTGVVQSVHGTSSTLLACLSCMPGAQSQTMFSRRRRLSAFRHAFLNLEAPNHQQTQQAVTPLKPRPGSVGPD